jgi:hypothetical protein
MERRSPSVRIPLRGGCEVGRFAINDFLRNGPLESVGVGLDQLRCEWS